MAAKASWKTPTPEIGGKTGIKVPTSALFSADET
jgi:hypothetical protein